MDEYFTILCTPPCDSLIGVLGILFGIALCFGVLIAMNIRKLSRRRNQERLKEAREKQLDEFRQSKD